MTSRRMTAVAVLPLFMGSLFVVDAAAQNRNSGSRPTSVPGNTVKPTQPPPAPATSTPPARSTGPTAVVPLAPEPFRLDAVGLTMRLPEDCSAQSTSVGGRATTQITPLRTNWILNIQIPRTSNPEATIGEAAQTTLAAIAQSVGVVGLNRDDSVPERVAATQAKLLERNDKLLLEGGAAARFYISIPNTDNSRLVKGYTIFKPQPLQYVVFELITAESEFEKVKPIYETIVGTAQFADSEAVMAERSIYVKTTQALLNSLTEADYAAAMHDRKVWHRLSKPATSGSPMDAEEIGYRGVRFWKGQRGEVDPDKPRTAWGPSEQERGYLCSVEGRFLTSQGLADTRGVYFMKPDRSEETWSVKSVFHDRSGKQVSAATETGARIGDSLTVVQAETGRPLKNLSPAIIGEGYLSKFDTFLLPRLAVRRQLQATLGGYSWSDREGVLAFRRDEIVRDGAAWTIRTSFREEGATQTYTYNEKGDLIRGEVDGLGIWEPIEVEALFNLWKQKGLPTGK